MKIRLTSNDGKILYGEFTTVHELSNGQRAIIEFENPISQTFCYRTEPSKRRGE